MIKFRRFDGVIWSLVRVSALTAASTSECRNRRLIGSKKFRKINIKYRLLWKVEHLHCVILNVQNRKNEWIFVSSPTKTSKLEMFSNVKTQIGGIGGWIGSNMPAMPAMPSISKLRKGEGDAPPTDEAAPPAEGDALVDAAAAAPPTKDDDDNSRQVYITTRHALTTLYNKKPLTYTTNGVFCCLRVCGECDESPDWLLALLF